MNRVSLLGKVLKEPKLRTIERRNGSIEIVSLWVEVKDEHRRDRFTIEINDPKAAETAKLMKPDVIVEVSGVLREDRWQIKGTTQWTGKTYVAIDPGAGTLRSKGMAPAESQQEAA